MNNGQAKKAIEYIKTNFNTDGFVFISHALHCYKDKSTKTVYQTSVFVAPTEVVISEASTFSKVLNLTIAKLQAMDLESNKLETKNPA